MADKPSKKGKSEHTHHSKDRRLETKSIRSLVKAAKGGNFAAYNDLGFIYEVSQNYQRAFQYYLKASHHNIGSAFANIGRFYLYGIGNTVSKDPRKAALYLEKGAQLGSPTAAANLGILYEKGEGVFKNLSKAAEYYAVAAQHKIPSACANLARFYETGTSVTGNIKNAIYYYRLAADGGIGSSCYNYGRLIMKNQSVEKSIEVAVRYFKKGIKLKTIKCYIALADLYESGECITQDYQKAATLYKYAADNNNAHACYQYARMLIDGNGVHKNYSIALEYFSKGAKSGDGQCCVYLAHCYEHGNFGVDQDLTKAAEYYIAGADLGNLECLTTAALILEKGADGIVRNTKRALQYLQAGASEEDPLATYHLGRFYQNGIFVQKNVTQAIKLYQQSMSGCPLSRFAIASIYFDGDEGYPQNFQMALKYFMENYQIDGYKPAALKVSEMYESGIGVPVDMKLALQWKNYSLHD